MATKIGLYNAALLAIGSARISSLTEARESRYELDSAYDAVLAECLEDGLWNFGEKSVEIESNPSVDPAFGFAYAFTIPDDFVRLSAVAADEYYTVPLERYHEEAGYWWADIDPLYIRYISDATDYGMDLSRWPASFTRFVELSLAERICMRVTEGDKKHENIIALVNRARKKARSRDAMNQPSPSQPQSNWLNARFGGGNYSGRRYERA